MRVIVVQKKEVAFRQPLFLLTGPKVPILLLFLLFMEVALTDKDIN